MSEEKQPGRGRKIPAAAGSPAAAKQERADSRRTRQNEADKSPEGSDKDKEGSGSPGSMSPGRDVSPEPPKGEMQLRRKDFGKMGGEGKVFANFIRLALKQMKVYVYQIDMSYNQIAGAWPGGAPATDEKGPIKFPSVRRIIFYDWMLDKGHTFCEYLNDYAYDGGSLIVAHEPFNFVKGVDVLIDEIRCNTERDVYAGSEGGSGGRMQTVHLRITYLKEVHIDPNNLGMELTDTGDQRVRSAQQMIDVIMRANRTAQLDRDTGFYRQFFPVARGIFQIPPNNQPQGVDLGCGLHHWQGLFSSVRACGEDKVPMVNFDVMNGGFHWMPGAPLNEYFRVTLPHMKPYSWGGPNGKNRFNDQNDLKMIQWPFRGLKVKAVHMKGKPQPYTVKRLYFKASKEMMFEWTPSRATSAEAVSGNARVQQFLAGRTPALISVYDYFRLFYLRDLQWPFLPLAEAAGRGTRGRGRGDHESRHNYFPLEVLEVATPQRFAGQLPDKGVGVIVKEAAKGPDHRMASIERMVRDACYVHDPFLDRFAIGLNNGLAVARARILPPPRVRFGGGFSVMPRDGVFSTGRNKPSFYKPRHINTFAVIFVAWQPPTRDQNDILLGFAQHAGMNARPFQGGECRQQAAHTTWSKPDGLAAAFEECCEFSKKQAGDAKPSIVFCIMLARDLTIYSDIKRIAEIDVGVMTQCLLIKTAGDMAVKPDTRENVYMKVNCKLGGLSFVPEPVGSKDVMEMMLGKEGATMVVGIDVTHPPPGAEKNQPSIAALLGSMDKELVTYKAVVKVQKVRRESIVYTFDAISDLIIAWTNKNPNATLTNLIVLRDGVGEGQMQQVVRDEARGLQQVFDVLLKQSPNITYIVVNKRHHTRFFPMNSKDPSQVSGRFKNVLPGLVVDRDVTDPQFFDWYQAPHQCIQGTTRPIKYTCLRNDAELSADCMQYLVHTLCHSFQRCTRAVHCPSAVYYAHLVALRASYHMKEPLGKMSSSGSSTSGDSDSRGDSGAASGGGGVVRHVQRAVGGGGAPEERKPAGADADSTRPQTPSSAPATASTASPSASSGSSSRSSRSGRRARSSGTSSGGGVDTGAGGDTTATADKLDETLAVPPVEEEGADEKAAGETTASGSDEKSAGDAAAAGEQKSKSSSDGAKKKPTDEDKSLSDGKHALDSKFAGFVKVHQDVYEKGMYFM